MVGCSDARAKTGTRPQAETDAPQDNPLFHGAAKRSSSWVPSSWPRPASHPASSTHTTLTLAPQYTPNWHQPPPPDQILTEDCRRRPLTLIHNQHARKHVCHCVRRITRRTEVDREPYTLHTVYPSPKPSGSFRSARFLHAPSSVFRHVT